MERNNKYEAEISEIFSSIQGEGLYAGERMTFVRFISCNMNCRYCDTPQGQCHREFCQLEDAPRTEKFKPVKNPIGITKLNHMLTEFDDSTIAVTGGEPLNHADFLAEWLPTQKSKRVLLETNGVLHENLSGVLPYVDVVSMDIKLPSSTGCGPKWNEHREFLKKCIAVGKDVYLKMVVTSQTSDSDIQKSISLMTEINRFIPVFIQPASPTLRFNDNIGDRRLESIERLCSAYLSNVRISRQIHKELGIL